MTYAVIFVPLLLWWALVYYEDAAPLQAWKVCFIPALLVLLILLKLMVLIASFGSKGADTYIEDLL